MPNNKSIQQCKWCDEYYCANCSTHSGFESYCSKECENEAIDIRDKRLNKCEVLLDNKK